MKLLVKRFAFREHRKDDGGELFGDESSGDRFALATLPALKLGFDFGEILNGANGRVVKRELEIAIPIAGALVPRLAPRVVRAWHQPTIRVKVPHAWEPVDVVDLEEQGVRDHLANAGHPHESLRVRRGEHAIAQFVIESLNVRLEKGLLRRVQVGLQARKRRQGLRRRDVVLLEQLADRDAGIVTARFTDSCGTAGFDPPIVIRIVRSRDHAYLIAVIAEARNSKGVARRDSVTLSLAAWTELTRAISQESFWRFRQPEAFPDGAMWMFERRSARGYRYAAWHSPGRTGRDSLAYTVGVRLLMAAGLDREEVY